MESKRPDALQLSAWTETRQLKKSHFGFWTLLQESSYYITRLTTLRGSVPNA